MTTTDRPLHDLPPALVNLLARRLYAHLPTVVYHGDGTERTLSWDEGDDDEKAWLLDQVRLILAGSTVVEEHRAVGTYNGKPVATAWRDAEAGLAQAWVDEQTRLWPGTTCGHRIERRWVLTTAPTDYEGGTAE